MTYSNNSGLAGTPQVSLAGLTVDATPRMQPGQFSTFVDSWWGAGEFIYARAAGSIRAFGVCVLTPVFDSTLNAYRFDATEAPNIANLGRMLCVSQNTLVSGNYSWFCISGITPVNCQASIAADTTFGIAAAGQGGANTAGKQILNARVIIAAAATVIKTGCNAPALGTVLQVPNSDGWFVGAYLSGTGIGAAAAISSISPDGRYVTMSVATTAAIIGGSITATYNNATIFYNVAHLNRPFAQGAIT